MKNTELLPGNPGGIVGKYEAYQSESISGWSILRNFFLSIGLVALSDVPNNWGLIFYLAQGLLGLFLIATFLLPVKKSVVLLLLLAIAGQDIVSPGDSLTSAEAYSTASLWQFNAGIIRPSWIIFICILVQLFKLAKVVVPRMVRRAIFWFASVPVITGLAYGGFLAEHAGVEVIVDMKFGFMLLASIILFLTVLEKDFSFLSVLLSAFTGALFSRHFIDLLYHFSNSGPMLVEGVSRASEDSAKGCVVFLVFFGIMLVWKCHRFFFGSIISVFSIVLLAVYGTRLLWVSFLVGALVLPFFMGLRRSFWLMGILILLTVAGVWVFSIISPETAEVVFARSKTITEGRDIRKFAVNVDYNLLSRIDPIRYGEIVNVFHASAKRFAYLWGTGYGSFYEDDAVDFPRDLKSSFPEYSLDSGRFYRTHIFSLQMFLKHGLVGLLLISALWWLPGFGLLKKLKREMRFEEDKAILFNGIMLCLVAFIPTAISQLYWSGKGLFINGAVLASCIVFAKHSNHPAANNV